MALKTNSRRKLIAKRDQKVRKFWNSNEIRGIGFTVLFSTICYFSKVTIGAINSEKKYHYHFLRPKISSEKIIDITRYRYTKSIWIPLWWGRPDVFCTYKRMWMFKNSGITTFNSKGRSLYINFHLSKMGLFGETVHHNFGIKYKKYAVNTPKTPILEL